MTDPAPQFDPLAPEWTAHLVRTIGDAVTAQGLQVLVHATLAHQPH